MGVTDRTKVAGTSLWKLLPGSQSRVVRLISQCETRIARVMEGHSSFGQFLGHTLIVGLIAQAVKLARAMVTYKIPQIAERRLP